MIFIRREKVEFHAMWEEFHPLALIWLGYLVFALGNGTIKPYIETGLGVVKLGTIFNNNIWLLISPKYNVCSNKIIVIWNYV